MTEQDFKDLLNKYDIMKRPKVIMLNPWMHEQILQAFPNIEDDYVLIADPCVDTDKAYIFDREELERWKTPQISKEDFKEFMS